MSQPLILAGYGHPANGMMFWATVVLVHIGHNRDNCNTFPDWHYRPIAVPRRVGALIFFFFVAPLPSFCAPRYFALCFVRDVLAVVGQWGYVCLDVWLKVWECGGASAVGGKIVDPLWSSSSFRGVLLVRPCVGFRSFVRDAKQSSGCFRFYRYIHLMVSSGCSSFAPLRCLNVMCRMGCGSPAFPGGEVGYAARGGALPGPRVRACGGRWCIEAVSYGTRRTRWGGVPARVPFCFLCPFPSSFPDSHRPLPRHQRAASMR